MFVKICGIRSVEELEVVERFADATGVVVMCKSKRAVDVERAKEIIEAANIPVFLVSTLPDFESWERVVGKVDSGYVQVHTDEISPEDVDRLKDLGLFVMKAFKVPRYSDNPEKDAKVLCERIEMYRSDMVLLDTGKGSGVTHDHRVSRIVADRFDIVLAGGLNPDNVCDIVKFVNPFGVDVSSGVERGNRKDEELIRRFVEAVRGCK